MNDARKINAQNESLFGDRENRIRFIQGAFYSLFTLYQRNQFYFHSAANIMLLLFQKPMAVSGFSRKEQGRLHAIWHSVSDPEFAEDFRKCVRDSYPPSNQLNDAGHIVQIPGTRFFIGLYDFTGGAFVPTSDPDENSPPSLLRSLFKRMEYDEHAKEAIGPLKMLFEGVYYDRASADSGNARPKKTKIPLPTPLPDVTEADITEYISRIRTDLIGNEIYSYVKDSPLLACRLHHLASRDDDLQRRIKRPFPNIFFILRTGSNNVRCADKGHDGYHYSLRFIIPDDQLEQITRHLRKHHDSRPDWDTDIPGEGIRCPCYDQMTRNCSVPNMGTCIHDDIFSFADDWTEKEWKEKISAILESPLKSDTRIISDTPLSSGVVEFTDEHETIGSKRFCADTPEDMSRIRLISCLEHQMYKNPRAVLYPIMLSGSPWITVVMVLPGGSEGNSTKQGQPHSGDEVRQKRTGKIPATAWMTTFQFVHSLLHCKLKDRLRFHAKDLYFHLLAEAFLSIYREYIDAKVLRYKNEDLPVMIKKINEKFLRISSIFPFPLVRFGEPSAGKPSCEREINLLPHGGAIPFHLMENPYFSRIVTVREFLKPDAVLKALENPLRVEINRLQEEFQKSYRETLDRLDQTKAPSGLV